MLFVNVCFVVCVFGDLEHKNIFALTRTLWVKSCCFIQAIKKWLNFNHNCTKAHKKRYCISTIGLLTQYPHFIFKCLVYRKYVVTVITRGRRQTETPGCICLCVCKGGFVCLLKINILPAVSDNDGAIFFRRQRFWTGFRLKDKETNLDLCLVAWMGNKVYLSPLGQRYFGKHRKILKGEESVLSPTSTICFCCSTAHTYTWGLQIRTFAVTRKQFLQ